MTDDCKLVESLLEDFLTDQTDAETRGRIEQHLEACKDCRDEVAGYEEVDRRITVYFDRQVAIAKAGGPHLPVRVGIFATASVMAGLALVALVLWLPGTSDEPTGAVPIASESPATVAAVVDEVAKATDLPAATRAKPATESGERAPSETASAGAEIQASLSFSITDTAGYSYALSDFAGSVMVMAVFDDQSPGAPAFQQAYDAFGATQNLRFLGVALTAGSHPDEVTFPVMLNRGSSLMDTPAGEFVVVTAEGEVHSRGSLQDDSLITSLSEALRELGVR